MILTKAKLIPAAVVLAGSAAVLAPGSPALAFISPPLVLLAAAESPAQLVAKGAAVDVTVDNTCTADQMFIGVQVTEKVGNKIASGFGATQVGCDGASHRTVVRVTASGSGAAFAKGTATVQTSVDGCRERNGSFMCGSDVFDGTIKIK